MSCCAKPPIAGVPRSPRRQSPTRAGGPIRYGDRDHVGGCPRSRPQAPALVVVIGYLLLPQPAQREATDDVPTAAALHPSSLIVRDGAEVAAAGAVLAAPGQPVRFCAPAPGASPGRPGDAGLPRCTFAVTVIGVDLDALSEPSERAGTRFGTAQLRGIWRAGTLTVTHQSAAPAQVVHPQFPDLPCAPPTGGWRSTGYVDGKALHEYVVDKHPDRFRRPWVAYPNRVPTGTTPHPDVVEVLVVEVVRGDLEQVRAELRRRYAGNLCVVHSPGRASLADQARNFARIQPAVSELMRDRINGVYSLGGGDAITVEMVMLTPELYDRFAAIGLDALELRPWLRPVR
jgi:hypothetical protein